MVGLPDKFLSFSENSKGGGVIQVGDGVFPIVDLGLGEKFYFSKSWGLKLDFRFMTYQGPDVLSRDLSKQTEKQSAASFGQKINYMSLLSLGAVYMF